MRLKHSASFRSGERLTNSPTRVRYHAWNRIKSLNHQKLNHITTYVYVITISEYILDEKNQN